MDGHESWRLPVMAYASIVGIVLAFAASVWLSLRATKQAKEQMIEGGNDPRPIEIRADQQMSSCNACSVVNYPPPPSQVEQRRPQVSVIYYVSVGPVAAHLCPACLVRLRAQIDETMYEIEEASDDPKATEKEEVVIANEETDGDPAQ